VRTVWASMFLVFASAISAQDDVSFVNEGIVDAPVADVWKVFATSDGYKVLGVALADVDLRIGGTIRSRYGSGGELGDAETIENVILAYEPPTMIAMRIQKTPQNFPFKQAWKNPWTVITLLPLDGGRTLVKAASLGYGTDEESLAMRRFFEAGNQQVIGNVQRHFAPAVGAPAAFAPR
jgi:uncharacterized protein YndB with AHSA1/START domain